MNILTSLSKRKVIAQTRGEEIIGYNYGIQMVFVCTVIVTIVRSIFWWDFMRNRIVLWWGLSLLIIIHLSIDRPFYYYGVSEQGLTEYKFGKRVRSIPWEKVVQVAVQTENVGYPGLVISLYGSMKYPDKSNLSAMSYYRRWRPRALYIADCHSSLPVLKKYYSGEIVRPRHPRLDRFF